MISVLTINKIVQSDWLSAALTMISVLTINKIVQSDWLSATLF